MVPVIPIVLAGLAVLLAWVAPGPMARQKRFRRAPRAALVAWQAVSVGGVLAALAAAPATVPLLLDGEDITHLHAPERAKLGLARTFQNIALFRGMTVLDNIKLGRHAHMHTGLLDALLYWGRARREEMALREEIERA